MPGFNQLGGDRVRLMGAPGDKHPDELDGLESDPASSPTEGDDEENDVLYEGEEDEEDVEEDDDDELLSPMLQKPSTLLHPGTARVSYAIFVVVVVVLYMVIPLVCTMRLYDVFSHRHSVFTGQPEDVAAWAKVLSRISDYRSATVLQTIVGNGVVYPNSTRFGSIQSMATEAKAAMLEGLDDRFSPKRGRTRHYATPGNEVFFDGYESKRNSFVEYVTTTFEPSVTQLLAERLSYYTSKAIEVGAVLALFDHTFSGQCRSVLSNLVAARSVCSASPMCGGNSDAVALLDAVERNTSMLVATLATNVSSTLATFDFEDLRDSVHTIDERIILVTDRLAEAHITVQRVLQWFVPLQTWADSALQVARTDVPLASANNATQGLLAAFSNSTLTVLNDTIAEALARVKLCESLYTQRNDIHLHKLVQLSSTGGREALFTPSAELLSGSALLGSPAANGAAVPGLATVADGQYDIVPVNSFTDLARAAAEAGLNRSIQMMKATAHDEADHDPNRDAVVRDAQVVVTICSIVPLLVALYWFNGAGSRMVSSPMPYRSMVVAVLLVLGVVASFGAVVAVLTIQAGDTPSPLTEEIAHNFSESMYWAVEDAHHAQIHGEAISLVAPTEAAMLALMDDLHKELPGSTASMSNLRDELAFRTSNDRHADRIRAEVDLLLLGNATSSCTVTTLAMNTATRLSWFATVLRLIEGRLGITGTAGHTSAEATGDALSEFEQWRGSTSQLYSLAQCPEGASYFYDTGNATVAELVALLHGDGGAGVVLQEVGEHLDLSARQITVASELMHALRATEEQRLVRDRRLIVWVGNAGSVVLLVLLYIIWRLVFGAELSTTLIP